MMSPELGEQGGGGSNPPAPTIFLLALHLICIPTIQATRTKQNASGTSTARRRFFDYSNFFS